MGRRQVAVGRAGIIVVMAIGAGQAATASGRLARADPPASVVAAKGSVVGRCQGRQLRIGLSQASPGASHHGYVLLFHNRGAHVRWAATPG